MEDRPKPEGTAVRSGGGVGEPGCRPGEQKAEDIGEIVPRVGKQRERARHEAEDRLHHHEGEIDRGANGKGPQRLGERVGVIVGMATVTMPVMGMVMPFGVVILMAIMRMIMPGMIAGHRVIAVIMVAMAAGPLRHALPPAPRPNAGPCRAMPTIAS